MLLEFETRGMNPQKETRQKKFELTAEDRRRIYERKIEEIERGKRLDKLRSVAKSMGVCIVQKTDKPTTLFL